MRTPDYVFRHYLAVAIFLSIFATVLCAFRPEARATALEAKVHDGSVRKIARDLNKDVRDCVSLANTEDLVASRTYSLAL